MTDLNHTPQYQPGAIVNGHVLTSDNQWVPVPPAAPTQSSVGPMTSANLNVKREVVYNREQKGHSLILHLLFGGFLLYIPTIYFAVSPNHYYHA